MKYSHLLVIGMVPSGFVQIDRCSSQLIAYEGFSYTTGSGQLYSTSGGANGGTGWGGAWSGFTTNASFNTINAGSMSYTDPASATLSTAGNSLEISSGATTAPSYTRALTSAITPTDGSVLWLSFLAAGSGGSTMGLTLYNGATQLLLLGNSGTNDAWGIRQLSGGSAFSSTGVQMASMVGTVGSTALICVNISFQAGNDVVEMFVNPTLGDTTPSTSSRYATQSLVDITSLSQISIGVGTANQKLDFDELRIGNSYADVVAVPEPSAMALVMISFAGFCLLTTLRRSNRIADCV